MEDSVKTSVCGAIERENDSLRELSLKIWNNPELCFNEHFAHKVLTDYMSERGFQVTKHYHLETAFRASYSNVKDGDGPSVHVGVLCEYDALPGIGHACGHNLIAIFGVSMALGIKEAMEAHGVKGKLTVLGTPAEEGGGGKIDLINAGAFADLDIALMAHPSQVNVPCPVYVAMSPVDVEYKGKASHAASFPWEGINALDAAVLCYQNVSCMRQQIKPSWRLHGIVTNGGKAPNIIPQTSALKFYTWAPTSRELKQLKQKLVGCIEGAARASGCQVKYTFDPKSYDCLLSNPTLASLYQRHGSSLGIHFVTDPVELAKRRESTDMGNVSKVLPSLHPEFGLDTEAPAHTEEFGVVAKTEHSHTVTLTHAKSLALAAVDVMQDPSLLAAIKEEFQAGLEQES